MSNKTFIRIVSEITLDGKITLAKNKSSRLLFPFESPELKLFTHQERAKFDAIMVGSNTIKIDNPLLTVRGTSGKTPARVVPCSSGKLPLTSNIFKETNKVRTIIIVSNSTDKHDIEKLKENGAEVYACGERKVNYRLLLNLLPELGIKNMILEGGSSLLYHFIKENLYDELLLKLIPIIVAGEDTPTPVGGTSFNVNNIKKHALTDCKKVGDYVILKYIPLEKA